MKKRNLLIALALCILIFTLLNIIKKGPFFYEKNTHITITAFLEKNQKGIWANTAYFCSIDTKEILKMKDHAQFSSLICDVQKYSLVFNIFNALFLSALLFLLLKAFIIARAQQNCDVGKNYIWLFFAALYPYFYLYVNNINEIKLLHWLAVLALLFLLALFLFFLFKYFSKNTLKSLLLMFISMTYLNFFQFFCREILLISALFITVACLVLIFDFKKTLIFFKTFGIVLCILLIFNAIKDYKVSFFKIKKMLQRETVHQKVLKPQNDVYIILLDMYAGETTLKKQFNYDNSDFYNKLKQLGFHVFNPVYSNYNKTVMTLASIFNTEYVDDKPYLNLDDAIYDASVLKDAKRNNYTTGYFTEDDEVSSPYLDTIQIISDLSFYASLDLFMSNTIFHRIVRQYRDKMVINNAAENLLSNFQPYDETAPRFYFIHLMAPHWPYLRDEDGKLNPGSKRWDIRTNYIDLETHINKKSYISYLKYTNQIVLKKTEEVIRNSKNPPVIVIFGDHGPRVHYYVSNEKRYFDKLSREDYFFQTHFETLLAIYCPKDELEKYKDIKTLINFFIEFSNARFGKNQKRVPDKLKYFHYDGDMYNFDNLRSKSYDATRQIFK